MAQFWCLKPDAKLLTDEEMYKLLTPEHVCGFETMLAAQQLLYDLGYREEITERDDDRDEDAQPVCCSEGSDAVRRGAAVVADAGDTTCGRVGRMPMIGRVDVSAAQGDDEVKLAPWRVSRNVINAFKNSGTLQITGSGDPTGRGEGFSFIRVPARTMASERDTGAIPRRRGV